MVSSVFAMCFALLLVGWANAESCPDARDKAEEKCNGRLGCTIPVCEGNDYRSYQCVGSQCYCVDTEGQGIADYSFFIGAQSDCSCARAVAAGEDVTCSPDGGFFMVS